MSMPVRGWHHAMQAMGPIERELRTKQYDGFELNFHSYTFLGANRRVLSYAARRLVNGSYQELTGMKLSCNEYYLADALSEAIEAAAALGL